MKIKIADSYKKVIDTVRDKGYSFLTCREYHKYSSNGAHPTAENKFVAIRHDIDNSLLKALEMAEYEHSIGIRSTYFLLHTAAYFRDDMHDSIEQLRGLGHEIGFHNNLLSLVCMNIDPEHFLKLYVDELDPVYGTTPHGGFMANKYLFSNAYIWEGHDAPPNASHPNDKRVAGRSFEKIPLDQYFEYDANKFKAHLYWFDNSKLNLMELLRDGAYPTLVLLIHPCHWIDGGKNDKRFL